MKARFQGGFVIGRQKQLGVVLVPYIVSALVSAAINYAISWLFAPSVKGPRLKDLGATGQGYGPPIARVKGTASVPGAIIWASPLIERANKSGGKGGGGSTTTYTYSQHVAIAVCEGPANVLRIWAGGKLIWDATTGTSEKKIIPYANVVVHTGSETQGVSSLIESFEGVGTTSAYRGICYVTLQNMQLEKFGNRLPPFQIECSTAATTQGTAIDCGFVGSGEWTGYGSRATYNSRKKVFVTVDGIDVTRLDFYEVDPVTSIASLAGSYATTGADDQFNSLCYVPSTNEIWATLYKGTNVVVLDADTYAYKALVSVAATTFFILAYNATDDTVWASSVAGGGTRIHSASTRALVATHPGVGGTSYPKIFELENGVMCFMGDAVNLLVVNQSGTIWQGYDLATGSGNDMVWDGTRKCIVACKDATTLYYLQFAFTDNTIEMFGDKTVDIDWASGTTSSKVHGGSGNGNIDSLLYHPGMDVYIGRALGSGNGNTIHFIDPVSHLSTSSFNFSGPAGGHVDMRVSPDNASLFLFDPVSPCHAWRIDLGLYAGAVPLAEVVSGLCDEAGLSASEYDVTGLDGFVNGYVISRPMSTRDAIEPLRAAYWFDAAESEGVVKFKMRGGASVITIPAADIGATEQQEISGEPFVISRANEEELPQQVDVHYWRAGHEYEEGVQHERVMNTTSTALNSLELALVLSDVKARDVAAVTLHTSRLERTGYQFSTGRKYAHLEPMDPVTVVYDGISYDMRLTSKDEAAGVIAWKGVAEDASLYAGIGTPGYASGFYAATESGTVGGVPVDVNDPTASIPATASTYARFLDLPPLLVTHTDLGIYVSVTPNRVNAADTWEGAVDYYSLDGGTAFNEGSVFDTEGVVGQATTTLGNHAGGDTVDLVNTMELEVAGELSSTTWTGILAGQNALLVGSEIINFQTATLIGTASNGINKNYRISKLLRGRRGTEQHIGTHAASEICILLDTRLRRFVPPETRIGDTLYRVASVGQDVDDLTSQTVTNSGVCLKPFSPVNLRGAKSAAAGWDINLTWDRRDRLYDGQITDATSAPMSEETEAYELEIYTTDFATLKRTVTGLSAQSYAYSNANQVTDFGSTQSSIGLKVYQMSAAVGRGFAGSSVVTAA